LKQFKIGKATYSESLIYEAYGGLQNDALAISGITKSNPKYDDTFFNIEDMVGESLIFSHESNGGLQNDGIMLAVYYDVDAAKIIHQLDSWEKINDSPTISSILKNNFELFQIISFFIFAFSSKHKAQKQAQCDYS